MSPGTIFTEPEATEQFKQGYKEGYEAGRAAIRRELKALLKTLSKKELQTFTSTGTYPNLTRED